MPDKETCNNKDDDCDTSIDEDFPVGGPCGTDIGECSAGTYSCDKTTGGLKCDGEVKPGVEKCDNLDNDCDGKTDEGNPEAR